MQIGAFPIEDPACLSACLPVCLSICLSVCRSAWLSVCLSAFMLAWESQYSTYIIWVSCVLFLRCLRISENLTYIGNIRILFELASSYSERMVLISWFSLQFFLPPYTNNYHLHRHKKLIAKICLTLYI